MASLGTLLDRISLGLQTAPGGEINREGILDTPPGISLHKRSSTPGFISNKQIEALPQGVGAIEHGILQWFRVNDLCITRQEDVVKLADHIGVDILHTLPEDSLPSGLVHPELHIPHECGGGVGNYQPPVLDAPALLIQVPVHVDFWLQNSSPDRGPFGHTPQCNRSPWGNQLWKLWDRKCKTQYNRWRARVSKSGGWGVRLLCAGRGALACAAAATWAV